MKRNIIAILLLSFLIFGTVSCKKETTYTDLLYDNYYANANDSEGDETKIDIKGSLMNGDMKHPNIGAKLKGNTLFIFFFETLENCMTLITAENGDMLFSRRMAKQGPSVVRVYLGNEPSGDYHLFITNGIKEAEGDFYLVGN